MADEWDDPRGVPISAILFGGRRPDLVPLVFEARDWPHGVFLGSTMSSARTAAAAGLTGDIRRDPMAMLPFCGYHMGDYFQHWLDLPNLAPTGDADHLPRIFYVNWFRVDDQGRYMWPGFGDNSRVLKWIFQRCDDVAEARDTPIGLLPRPADLDTADLDISPDTMAELLRVDRDGWLRECNGIETHFARFGDALPDPLRDQLAALRQRLST